MKTRWTIFGLSDIVGERVLGDLKTSLFLFSLDRLIEIFTEQPPFQPSCPFPLSFPSILKSNSIIIENSRQTYTIRWKEKEIFHEFSCFCIIVYDQLSPLERKCKLFEIIDERENRQSTLFYLLFLLFFLSCLFSSFDLFFSFPFSFFFCFFLFSVVALIPNEKNFRSPRDLLGNESAPVARYLMSRALETNFSTLKLQKRFARSRLLEKILSTGRTIFFPLLFFFRESVEKRTR